MLRFNFVGHKLRHKGTAASGSQDLADVLVAALSSLARQTFLPQRGIGKIQQHATVRKSVARTSSSAKGMLTAPSKAQTANCTLARTSSRR